MMHGHELNKTYFSTLKAHPSIKLACVTVRGNKLILYDFGIFQVISKSIEASLKSTWNHLNSVFSSLVISFDFERIYVILNDLKLIPMYEISWFPYDLQIKTAQLSISRNYFSLLAHCTDNLKYFLFLDFHCSIEDIINYSCNRMGTESVAVELKIRMNPDYFCEYFHNYVFSQPHVLKKHSKQWKI